MTKLTGLAPLDLGSINYRYSSDLNKTSEIEKIVVKKAGHLLFSTILRQLPAEYEPDDLKLISRAATMPPRLRAEACLLILKTLVF